MLGREEAIPLQAEITVLTVIIALQIQFVRRSPKTVCRRLTNECCADDGLPAFCYSVRSLLYILQVNFKVQQAQTVAVLTLT